VYHCCIAGRNSMHPLQSHASPVGVKVNCQPSAGHLPLSARQAPVCIRHTPWARKAHYASQELGTTGPQHWARQARNCEHDRLPTSNSMKSTVLASTTHGLNRPAAVGSTGPQLPHPSGIPATRLLIIGPGLQPKTSMSREYAYVLCTNARMGRSNNQTDC